MSVAEILPGSAQDVLLLCDHASNAVPPDIDLGIDPALLNLHIGIDIGAADVTRALAARLDAPAILATVSRLVIDLHREPDHIGLIPHRSDGHAIPGNEAADRAARIARFHAPYHRVLRDRVRRQRPSLILSIHSFTPCLEHGGTPRPWEIGILYNRDTRAAGPAVEWLRAQGLVTGDNEPYSGRLLNATLNRHAEAQGIPSIAIEIRNDLIRDTAGVQAWAARLQQLALFLRNTLASKGVTAT
ncbi:N-formylglutamate amidohydrolase [Sphingomonas sp. ABOLD]|uniref:Putative N-formylglutamate amidohydrolase n=1 Tax=Sphingomonas trueperi TaxID=53317 RepID=A0A7X5Y0C6_9SPHN|nr:MULTISPECIES: N-formylglutamate amidohydrolase [Sphingomonas]NJB97415.1 putative N-formylglutamate amidohydrolase [Sphingomonas trueperi]RSV45955.1 N-formylglutamate amidohydrolase [Sphingomonas sp. ABOLD]